jgi:hypothetical protein
MTQILSKAELAEELRVTRGRISQLIGRGMPVRFDGRVDLEDACRWIVDNLDPTNADRGSRAWREAREWVRIFDHKP